MEAAIIVVHGAPGWILTNVGNFPPVYKAGAIERYATGAVEEATGLEPAKPVKVSAVFETAALPN